MKRKKKHIGIDRRNQNFNLTTSIRFWNQNRFSIPNPSQEGPSVPSGGLEISPPTRTVETVGLASEGAQLIDSGLSTEVVETILHSRAPSTRKLYALKGRVFTSWCSDHQLDHIPLGGISLGKTPWYLIFLRGTWGSVLLSECGPGKVQFALPSTGIRCLYPQSCPVV